MVARASFSMLTSRMAAQEVEACEMILPPLRRAPASVLASVLTSARAPAVASAALIALSALACSSSSKPAQDPTTVAKATATPTIATRVTAFGVSIENLNVDKVGMRDGFMKPDGARDLAFTTTIDGPFVALFVVSTNAKGEPTYGLRADTLTGADEIPVELGGVIDTGKMTTGMGVVEGGKFINGESGSARGGPGIHNLTLYVPNTANLQAGSFVRLYLRAPGSNALIPGPVTPY